MKTFDDFIIGNDYRFKNCYDSRSHICIYKDDDVVVLKYKLGSGYAVVQIMNPKAWEEAPPPKKTGKLFVNVYDDGVAGPVWSSRGSADGIFTRRRRIACVEVDWTEGDGL